MWVCIGSLCISIDISVGFVVFFGCGCSVAVRCVCRVKHSLRDKLSMCCSWCFVNPYLPDRSYMTLFRLHLHIIRILDYNI